MGATTIAVVDLKEDHQTPVVVVADHQDKETQVDGQLQRETHQEAGVATIQNNENPN